MRARNIPLKLAPEVIQRLDRLTAVLSERAAGIPVSRADLMRTAMERGLDAIERELLAKKRKSVPRAPRKGPKPRKD